MCFETLLYPPFHFFSTVMISNCSVFQAQDINRQFEEKLKSREAEIFRLREETRSRQNEMNSVGQRSRRQSTTNNTQYGL